MAKILGPHTKVKDLMRSVVTIDSDRTAVDAARLMTREGVGCLVAVKGGSVVGIITERDMVIRVLTQEQDPKKVKVENFMTKNVLSLSPNATILEAIEFMNRHRIRRVPIMDDGRLVGIITADEITLLGCLRAFSR